MESQGHITAPKVVALVLALIFMGLVLQIRSGTDRILTDVHNLKLTAPAAIQGTSYEENVLRGACKSLRIPILSTSGDREYHLWNGKAELAKGIPASVTLIRDVATRISERNQAELLPGLIALAYLVFCFYPALAKGTFLLSPLLLLVAACGIALPCPLCTSSGSLIDVVAPLGLVTLACLVITCLFVDKRWLKSGVWCFAVLAALSQTWLVYTHGRFCPFCLIAGIGLGSVILTVPSIQAPLRAVSFRNAAVLGTPCLGMGILSVGLTLNWFPALGHQHSVQPSTFLGHIVPAVSSAGGSSTKSIYAVVKQGCSACQEAERELGRSAPTTRYVGLCTDTVRTGCFEAQSDNQIIFPLLLQTDERGKILYQHVGWPTSKEEANYVVQQLNAK